MTATYLPDGDNVVRYVGRSKIREDNRIDGTAFCRRHDEDSPSINWLEFFSSLNKTQQVAEVRRLIHLRTLGASSQAAGFEDPGGLLLSRRPTTLPAASASNSPRTKP